MGPENLHLNKFPGDADAVGPVATLGEPLVSKFFIKEIRVWLVAHFFIH